MRAHPGFVRARHMSHESVGSGDATASSLGMCLRFAPCEPDWANFGPISERVGHRPTSDCFGHMLHVFAQQVGPVSTLARRTRLLVVVVALRLCFHVFHCLSCFGFACALKSCSAALVLHAIFDLACDVIALPLARVLGWFFVVRR